jgi:hypothetical protein
MAEPVLTTERVARTDPGKKLFTDSDAARFERAKIEHEDDLVNQRLSWLTTSQAIFFAAYVFGFSKTPNWPSVFRRALPPLAILTCAAFYVGLIAAMHAATIVRTNWNKKFQQYDDYRDALLAGSEWTRRSGRVPAGVVPLLFMVAWICAIVYDFGYL